MAWHGLPVARERGLRPVVSHTYIRTCDSTYTHIHDERHRYPGALNSHLIASNDNEEREYPSRIPAQLPHPPLLQPPVRPLTCPIAIAPSDVGLSRAWACMHAHAARVLFSIYEY